MAEKRLPKVLLLGLDAACWEYVDPLIKRQLLPNLAGLIARGTHGILRSVMPPITPVAWSSIATGVNPGKHAVYEWVQRNPENYRFQPVNATHRVGTTFWERLNAAGVRTGIVNIPLTHPVRPVEGFLLCGFSAPASLRDLTYPQPVLAEIEARFGPYRPDVEKTPEGHSSPQAFRAEREFQARQVRIASWLAQMYQVDFLAINLMLLDHANHLMPELSTVEQAIIESDADLGLLLDEFRPDNVLLISDHGSRRVGGAFLLQAWLAEHNYLKRPARPPEQKAQVLNYLLRAFRNGGDQLPARLRRRLQREGLLRLPRSLTAPFWLELENAIPLATLKTETLDRFSPSETQVYIPGGHRGNLALNLVDREPKGIVQKDDREAFLARLGRQLSEITDPETGEPLFEAIYRPENLYTGPFSSNSPDLICDYYASDWSIVSTIPGLTPRPWRYFQTMTNWFGDHTRDGIYVFAGSDIRTQMERGRANLLDIPATVLYLYDVPLPDDYDGRPLVEAVQPGLVSQRPVRFQPGDERRSTGAGSGYSSEMEAEIHSRLVALGYLDD